MFVEQQNKSDKIRWWKHFTTLLWKSYLQRKRRWRTLLSEVILAVVLFGLSIYAAKPVFITPLTDLHQEPISMEDVLKHISPKTYLAYAPNVEPFNSIMKRAAEIMKLEIKSAAATVKDIGDNLYDTYSKAEKLVDFPLVWVVWENKASNTNWKVNIRTTGNASSKEYRVQNLAFLAVQISVSEAIVEYVAKTTHKLSLQSMPESPLMRENAVHYSIAWMLLYFTVALMPPVLETTALVVNETNGGLKRALCLHHVDYSAMYFGWLCYAFLTATPIMLLAGIVLIFTFRWLAITSALFFIFNYEMLMLMMALNMAMFHYTALRACIWCMLMIVMQTFLAQLLNYNRITIKNSFVSFILHVSVPPLGLVNGFYNFALQTACIGTSDMSPVSLTNIAWVFMSIIYFVLLMMLQRTLGGRRAIRGQKSWKRVLFRKDGDVNKFHPVYSPTGKERERLQQVDDLVGKAITFTNVSKSIMGRPFLKQLNFDIYRGEYSMLYSDRIQKLMLATLEDLITGLIYPDTGTINILGHFLEKGKNFITCPHMIGYCHRSSTLMGDFTVQEHLVFFMQISIWSESNQYVQEYEYVRVTSLLKECDLENVKDECVKHLSSYYHAQLCWALALLLEPRIIFMPNFIDSPIYISVIVDKIQKYKGYLTIIQNCITSIRLEFADRVFLFNHHHLVFGGTPAYMFFSYGRDYRIRFSISTLEHLEELLNRIREAGGVIFQNYYTMIFLKMPVKPTEKVAALINDVSKNSEMYGVSAINLSLADSEEVCRRVIAESSRDMNTVPPEASIIALNRLAEPPPWTRTTYCFSSVLRLVGWKFLAWHSTHKFGLFITVICSIVAGSLMGQAITVYPSYMAATAAEPNFIVGTLLSVEESKYQTNLVVQADNSAQALSVTNAYVLSTTNADHITYTALHKNDTLLDYLMYIATHDTYNYVFLYAYGMVAYTENSTLHVQALYSHLHADPLANARSVARVYSALLRHYTDNMEATIQVVDQPISMEIDQYFKNLEVSPMLIQVMLLLTVCHITLLPSREYGLIRHVQANALHFSPLRYWLSLYFWDLSLHCVLVALTSGTMVGIMYLALPWFQVRPSDLFSVPSVLMAYGVGCIPQAYLFSLGSNPTLNLMLFVMVNTVFGQSTILSMLYKNALAEFLYRASPQSSIAYCFQNIKRILTYNAECMIFFKDQNLCDQKALTKCCPKCGVLQQCFERTPYFSFAKGILPEVVTLLLVGVVFFSVLLLWEYKIIKICKHFVMSRWIYPGKFVGKDAERPGALRENQDVAEKLIQMELKTHTQEFGNCLLVSKLSCKSMGTFSLVNISFGVNIGEALGLCGIQRHGRTKLCEVLAGFRHSSYGDAIIKSKWHLKKNPHTYSKRVSLFGHRPSVPNWMSVYDVLHLIAAMRGVPKTHIKEEVMTYIDALELTDMTTTRVCNLRRSEVQTLRFAVAVVGAPPVIILDEYICFNQRYSVRQTIYRILNCLKKRGHGIISAAANVRTHLPVSDRLAILLNGHIYDIDTIDELIQTYSKPGYTVVMHFKNHVDVTKLFSRYFTNFTVNDTSEVLANVQVVVNASGEDGSEDLAILFNKMEKIQLENPEVYSYIVTTVPIDYIFNLIILNESWQISTAQPFPSIFTKMCRVREQSWTPDPRAIENLEHFNFKFNFMKLDGLPWSVIFQR